MQAAPSRARKGHQFQLPPVNDEYLLKKLITFFSQASHYEREELFEESNLLKMNL